MTAPRQGCVRPTPSCVQAAEARHHAEPVVVPQLEGEDDLHAPGSGAPWFRRRVELLAGDPAHAMGPSHGPSFHGGVSRTAGCGSSLLEGCQVGVTATVRQAKLRRECADRYPTLPARMWTSAARLAELVASYRRGPQRPGKIKKKRTLSEADFEFRGGSPRWLGGLIARTRTGEPAFGW